MVLVRRIHKRGANIVVEANGEVLFAPTGPVGRWTNRFSQRVRAFAAEEAPSNKRPRWGHYGKPLKMTMKASTTYQPGRMKVYAAVGSTSPHAYYVDQGTGVYAGHSEYEAKVLPPWHRGSPSLYEHTWRPGGPGTRKVKPVMIRGQQGQFFFDSALKRGFMSMRMRSFQVPGDAQITRALASFPTGLAGFLGNTEANGAFIASLTEWRSWRDAAWRGEPGPWGDGGINVLRQRRAKAAAEAAQVRQNRRRRSHSSVKPKRPPKPPRSQGPTKAEIMAKYLAAIKKERADLLAQAKAQYKGKVVTVSGRRKHGGVWAYEVTVTKPGAPKAVRFWVTSDYQASVSL